MAAVPESTGAGPGVDGAVVAEKLPAVAAVVVAERAKPGSIVIAELPERPIPRGIAGPGLLAYVLVSKFADHCVPRRHRREPAMAS